MKTTKKILCAILITSMLFTFSSCVKRKDGLTSKQIKATVMAEMNSDQNVSVQSPDEIFKTFMGDFTIESPSTTGSMRKDIKRIYLKDGVYGIEYISGDPSYEAIYKGYLFSLSKDNTGRVSLVGYTQLGEEDYKSTPSIFEYLDIDISFSGSSDETEAPKDIPTLTEDMLTVSEDRSTCTFSADYMNQFAKVFFDIMDSATDEESNIIEATGVYKVTENTYEFVVAGVSKSFEYRRITINYSNSEENGPNLYMKMEFPVRSNGMTLPTVAEVSMKDITYVDNKPVKATIESKYSVSDAKGKIQGLDYSMNLETSSCFTLDITNEASPKLTGKVTNNQTVSVDGNTDTTKTESSIECVFSDGTDSMLSFSKSVTSNGQTTNVSMKSSNLKLGAPADASIPAAVNVIIKQKYAALTK
ncbi:MAG: hypothetical protein J6Q77_02915 [Clostridia bacterium]|nr:hypothetical protein [Clostridia bacterium]